MLLLNLHKTFISRVKILLLTLVSFSNLYSEDLELQNNLYKDPYWEKLLHYKYFDSEIDSDNFFLTSASSSSSLNLKEELFETIKSLENGTNDVLCRFPLRTKWLKENIKDLKIKEYECKELDEYLKQTDAKSLSLVFPTAHINSPASMYGHTFIKASSQIDTPLISNALNYAAKTDEQNGFIYAFKGVFGGYEGRYSILPYYEKIKEYNNLEQRDIWEYDLNLNQEEIDRLMLHAWELKDSYADYKFFTENCSYSILWLFEVARPNLNLVKKFNFKAIPLDTIKEINKQGLITNSNYRYSNMKKMKHIKDEKIENKSYIKEFLTSDTKLENSLSISDKISYLDLKIAYTQYLRTKDDTKKDEYVKEYLKLLKQRSEYKTASNYEVKEPINPLFSHDSAKFSFFYTKNDEFNLGIKPAYNDIYDISDGYLEGAYIDFFDLNLKSKKNKSVKLDRFSLLKIKSISPIDEIFKPLSWAIDTGFEDFKEDDKYFKLMPEFGYSFGNENNIFYTLISSKNYIKAHNRNFSLGFNSGLILNPIKNLKIGTSYSLYRFDSGFINRDFESFFSYSLHRNLALNLKYQNSNLLKKQDSLKVGLFLYF